MRCLPSSVDRWRQHREQNLIPCVRNAGHAPVQAILADMWAAELGNMGFPSDKRQGGDVQELHIGSKCSPLSEGIDRVPLHRDIFFKPAAVAGASGVPIPVAEMPGRKRSVEGLLLSTCDSSAQPLDDGMHGLIVRIRHEEEWILFVDARAVVVEVEFVFDHLASVPVMPRVEHNDIYLVDRVEEELHRAVQVQCVVCAVERFHVGERGAPHEDQRCVSFGKSIRNPCRSALPGRSEETVLGSHVVD